MGGREALCPLSFRTVWSLRSHQDGVSCLDRGAGGPGTPVTAWVPAGALLGSHSERALPFRAQRPRHLHVKGPASCLRAGRRAATKAQLPSLPGRKVQALRGPGGLIKQFPHTPPAAAPPSRGPHSRGAPKPGPMELRPRLAGLSHEEPAGALSGAGQAQTPFPRCWPRGTVSPGSREAAQQGPWAALSLSPAPSLPCVAGPCRGLRCGGRAW